MDFTSLLALIPPDAAALIAPAGVAAAISGLISLLGVWIAVAASRRIQKRGLAAFAARPLRPPPPPRPDEFAEQVLADFYQARELIQDARLSSLFDPQVGARRTVAGETNEEARALNGYRAVAERLINREAFFAQLQARRQRSIALFGEDALKPYDDLYTLRRTIIHAAQMLIETYQHDGGATLSARSEWEAIISQGKSSPDVIASALTGIVQAIEHICRPVIQKTVR